MPLAAADGAFQQLRLPHACVALQRASPLLRDIHTQLQYRNRSTLIECNFACPTLHCYSHRYVQAVGAGLKHRAAAWVLLWAGGRLRRAASHTPDKEIRPTFGSVQLFKLGARPTRRKNFVRWTCVAALQEKKEKKVKPHSVAESGMARGPGGSTKKPITGCLRGAAGRDRERAAARGS